MDSKNINKQYRFGYLGNLFFWLLLSMYLYRSLFFRSIFDFTVNQSKAILWVWVIIFCLFSYVLTDARTRTRWNIFLTLLFPYELYAFFTYSRYFHALTIVLACLSVIVLGVYLLWTWVRPIPQHRKRSSVIRSRIRLSIYYMRSIPVLFLFPFLIVVLITLLRGGTIIVPIVDTAHYEVSKKSTLHANLDMICKLDNDLWEVLSAQEKLDVLQVVANIERNNLGIYHKISVHCGITDDDSIVGQYDPLNQIVRINIDHLNNDPPDEVLDTVIHECYHAYQWCLVHLYENSDEQYRGLNLFADAKQYMNEFANYHNSGDTRQEFEAYYYQSVELNARIYSASEVENYLASVELYS